MSMIAVAIVIIGLVLTIEIQRRSLKTLTDSLLTTQQNLERTDAAAKAYRDSAQQQLLVISEERNQALERQKNARVREREIKNVSADKDGPVSAVLRDSLSRLR